MDVEKLLRKGESQEVEFRIKYDKSREGRRNLADIVAAFANTDGGTIIFGVEDSGEVVGLPLSDIDLSQIKNHIESFLDPVPEIRFRFETFEKKRLGIIEVDKSKQTITSRGGKPPIRRGTATVYKDVEYIYKSQREAQRRAMFIMVAITSVLMALALGLIETILVGVSIRFLMTIMMFTVGFLLPLGYSLIKAETKYSAEASRTRIHAFLGKSAPLVAMFIVILEFAIAYVWLSFGMSQLGFLTLSNLAMYLILGAIDLVPSNRLAQWSGLFLIAILAGFSLATMQDAETLPSIVVELSGVFVGLLGAFSLGETWKEIENRRRGRDLELLLIEELDSIQNSILQNTNQSLQYPIWDAITSGGDLLSIRGVMVTKLSRAYQAISTYISQPTRENKNTVLNLISDLTRSN